MRILKNNAPDQFVEVVCPGCQSILAVSEQDLRYVFGHGVYVDPCPVCRADLSKNFRVPKAWGQNIRNIEDLD